MVHETDGIEAVLAELPEPRRQAFEAVRAVIREAAPAAVERVGQGGMTGRSLVYETEPGRMLCALASGKTGMTLHLMPLSCHPDIAERYGSAFGRRRTGKSCVRFTKPEQLPLDTVSALLREGVACGATVKSGTV